jgi:hypothetical protein
MGCDLGETERGEETTDDITTTKIESVISEGRTENLTDS